MKVLFLDIDGVLNSKEYDAERDFDNRQNIDKTRLVLVKELVDKTHAKIVLSSSWRIHWDKDERKCDETGIELNEIFGEYGLKIFDKTPTLNRFDRADEIQAWLSAYGDRVESFVIIDDEVAWKMSDLRDHLVRTDYMIGRGLEIQHIQKAIEILT